MKKLTDEDRDYVLNLALWIKEQKMVLSDQKCQIKTSERNAREYRRFADNEDKIAELNRQQLRLLVKTMNRHLDHYNAWRKEQGYKPLKMFEDTVTKRDKSA